MINTVNLPPFKKMCMTIGNLPSSFMESLTYYEALCWLYNYFEKTLLPAINTNSEAITELQEAFVALKTYVDTYFDDLDIQQEVNNKLDDMAESGELTELLTTYLQLKTIYSFNSVAELVASENFIDGSFAKTTGFYANNDGGGANYKIRTILNTDTIDNIHLFAITNDDTLVAELNEKEIIDVRQLGAKTDIDNSEIIQYAVDNFKEININEDYEIYSAISVTEDNVTLKGNGKIHINHSKEDNLLEVENVDNFNIIGLSFYNDDVRSGSSAPDLHFIIKVTGSTNIIFDDIKVYNAYYCGVEFEESSNIKVINSSFKDCYYDMLTFLTETSDILIDNCIFDTATSTYANTYLISTGAREYSTEAAYLTKNLTIQNSKFLNNPNWEGIDSHGCENLKILNNYVYNCKDGISIWYDTRKLTTYKYGDNIIIKNNIIDGGTADKRIGIYVAGNVEHYIKNIKIEDNIVKYYGVTSGYAGVFVENIKDFIICNNTITKFSYHGLHYRNCISGQINKNHIYGPNAGGTFGMYSSYGAWMVKVFNNMIHGEEYKLARGLSIDGQPGITIVYDNLVYNFTSYKYQAASGNYSPIGTIINSYQYRMGIQGVKAVNNNDMITSYCTDTVLRAGGKTLNELTLSATAGSKTIELTGDQNILNFLTEGEEFIIPGAGTDGANLTTTVGEIYNNKKFTIQDNIITSVSNVHPIETGSSWTTV